MENCKNCGAPLHSYKCEYCGTEYPELLTLIRLPLDNELEEYRLKRLLHQIHCCNPVILKPITDINAITDIIFESEHFK